VSLRERALRKTSQAFFFPNDAPLTAPVFKSEVLFLRVQKDRLLCPKRTKEARIYIYKTHGEKATTLIINIIIVAQIKILFSYLFLIRKNNLYL